MSANEVCVIEVPNGLVVTDGGANREVMRERSRFVISDATGDWETGSYTGARQAPTHDEIAELAFSFYEARGRQDGHQTEDWLRAEAQLARHYA